MMEKLRCKDHPRYTGGSGGYNNRPRTQCKTCWKVWEQAHEGFLKMQGEKTMEVEKPAGAPGKATQSRLDKAYAEGLQKGLEHVDAAFVMPRPLPKPTWSFEGSVPKSSPGTPLLFISDIHAAEVVNREEMSGKNEYSWEIMEARLKTVFSMTAELLCKHLALPNYDGIVVAFGGDMLSGDIHDELRETNEKGLLEAAFDLSEILVGHLLGLAEVFGNVYVVGVPGNHPRTTKKPRNKGYNSTNADYLLYRMIARVLKDDKRFTFNFPLSRDVRFDVAGRRFLLTHGDQFKTGDAMIGPIGAVLRGDARKRTNASVGLSPNQVYDTLLCADKHTLFMTPSVIINGSLKGLDEYASGGNLREEFPYQVLITVHPKHGITWFVPIHCYPYLGEEV